LIVLIRAVSMALEALSVNKVAAGGVNGFDELVVGTAPFSAVNRETLS
jgi:hypothetical protein